MEMQVTAHTPNGKFDPIRLFAPGNIDDEKPGVLTTDHATASYGQPVLVIDGVAHGPGDLSKGTMITPADCGWTNTEPPHRVLTADQRKIMSAARSAGFLVPDDSVMRYKIQPIHFVDATGNAPDEDLIEGYYYGYYFVRGGRKAVDGAPPFPEYLDLEVTYPTHEEAEQAAQDAYLGADIHGIGVEWEIKEV